MVHVWRALEVIDGKAAAQGVPLEPVAWQMVQVVIYVWPPELHAWWWVWLAVLGGSNVLTLLTERLLRRAGTLPPP